MRYVVAILLPLLLFGCTSQQVNQVLNTALNGGLTSEDIGKGLKEALRQGAEKGANDLSLEGGYYQDAAYRILLPPEGQKVLDKLDDLGLSSLTNEVIKKINRGAEEAAKEAAPIFVNAIRQMTIQDAMGILKGDRNAATQYLQRTTSSQLYNAFQPVIRRNLDQVGANKAWSDVATRYNQIPFVDKVNVNLDDHVADRALDGLFDKVALEEENIRNNLQARTSELLRRVFALQDTP